MDDRRDLAEGLLNAVAEVNRWATRLADLPLSHAQARLLAQIDTLAPVRVGDLARAENCSQPTITVALQRIERQAWIARTPDPCDSRASLVELSEEGRQILGTARQARIAAITPALKALDADQRTRLSDAVGALHELLESATDEQPRNVRN